MIPLFLPAKLRVIVRRHKPLRWLIDVTMLLILVSIMMVISYKIFEKPEAKGPLEAYWQTWQTNTTIGYGNLPPSTWLGRFSFMTLGTSALALFGTFISAIFMAIEYQKDRVRLGMTKNPFKNGYVIINFPGEDKFQTFFDEITFIEEGVGICIVDNNLTELPETVALLSNVRFIQSSILDQETLEKANIKNNKAVIIFTPQQISDSFIDGLTAKVVENIEEFSQNSKVIYEIIDANRHAHLFQNVKGTAVRADMVTLATAQECDAPGTVDWTTLLLQNTSGPNYHTVKPELTEGWTWEDLLIFGLRASRNLQVFANFLGIFHDARPFPCPLPDALIRPGDTLLVAAFPGLNWQKFEEEMARCKAAASSS